MTALGLGPSKRVRSILFGSEANGRNPLINKAGILPRTDVVRMINPAGEGKVVHSSTAPPEPCKQTRSGVSHQLELHRRPRFLLYHHAPRSDFRSGNERPDLDLHEIASPQFAVDGEVEQSAIPKATLPIKKKPDCPYSYCVTNAS
mgnify:CR=1 FL=1